MKRLVLSLVAINLNPADWEQLKYSGIAANQLSQQEKSMVVEVKQSASPLIYILPKATQVESFEIKGSVDKALVFAEKNMQGEKKQDDFQLRLGFVVAGEKRLSGFKAMFAADWVKKLFSLAKDKKGGIDRIQFYNLAAQDLKWVKRKHPLSDLIEERIVGKLVKAGSFATKFKLDKPLNVLAIWLSIDGDDTKASYKLVIDKLNLKTK